MRAFFVKIVNPRKKLDEEYENVGLCNIFITNFFIVVIKLHIVFTLFNKTYCLRQSVEFILYCPYVITVYSFTFLHFAQLTRS